MEQKNYIKKYNFNFRKGKRGSLKNRYNFERYPISNFPCIIKWYANSHDTGHDNYRPLIRRKTSYGRLPVRTCREKWIERRIYGEIGSCSLNGSLFHPDWSISNGKSNRLRTPNTLTNRSPNFPKVAQLIIPSVNPLQSCLNEMISFPSRIRQILQKAAIK